MLYVYCRQITQCDVYNSDVIYEAFHLCLKISLLRIGRIFCQRFAKQVVYIEQLISDADSVSGLSMYVIWTNSLYSTAAEKSKWSVWFSQCLLMADFNQYYSNSHCLINLFVLYFDRLLLCLCYAKKMWQQSWTVLLYMWQFYGQRQATKYHFRY